MVPRSSPKILLGIVLSATVTEHIYIKRLQDCILVCLVNMEVKFDYGVDIIIMCYYTSEETLSVLSCVCNMQYKSYALKIQHDYNK